MFIAKTVATALLVTAFGGLASPGTDGAYANKGKMESIRATCMKEQGFRYLPEPVIKHKWTKEERARLAGDYEALRAYRAKYGFGVWSKLVFPDDKVVNPDSGESRNNKTMMSLSPSELKKYRAADNTCFSKAVKEVLGKSVSSFAGYLDKLDAALEHEVGALDSDKKLAQLGKEFAGCLKIAETRPSVLAERGRTAFRKEATEVARTKQPDPIPKHLQGENFFMKPMLSPEEAKPYLDKEVDAALADLECGKAFYQGYSPRARAAGERVYQEFALDFAL
ncbi:hypothetical protein ABZ297_27370 [Nonomuraea sp. NPDC005983]|uniref:hypothetical protein n=1 Tax=Nonomuraea sp. NPDC005983 TaxID=3155595 RepID=UPI0033BE3DD3